MFTSDRDTMRQFFCDCRNKDLKQLPLEPLEKLVAQVIREHPEYHVLLDDADTAKAREYLPELNETNPFLHMSMHLGIREQVLVDKPDGIAELIRQLALKNGEHEAEHQVMDCLAEMMWQSQRSGTPPDETGYMQCIRLKLQG